MTGCGQRWGLCTPGEASYWEDRIPEQARGNLALTSECGGGVLGSKSVPNQLLLSKSGRRALGQSEFENFRPKEGSEMKASALFVGMLRMGK